MSDLVSIVVPIYNVEPYLDECIRSIVNQTYTNLEILLINDGSTDGSLPKCEEWASKDKRIRVFSKENEGLGPTRNYGVKHANGEWIAFIDSDDWIATSYIEKLYLAAIEQSVDMARCNINYIGMNGRGGKQTNYFQVLGVNRESNSFFLDDAQYVNKLIIRKKIFDIYFLDGPNCKGQDFAVGLAMCFAAGKSAYVNEALYYYRAGRPGSLTTGRTSKRNETAEVALPWLISILKRNNFYDQNIWLIQKYVLLNLSRQLFGGWMNMPTTDYIKLKEIYFNAIIQNIGYEHIEVAHLGSWNLVETMRKIPFLQDMDYAFHFSSLISIMSNGIGEIEIVHRDLYRNKMVARDRKSSMWKIFDRKQPDYFIFDLLEERNNIIKFEECFITESDAFRECEVHIDNAQIIRNGSDEWFELWKQSCDAFMKKLQNYISLDKVIMVRNYLAESYGTVYEQKEYEDIQKIRSANEVIRNCYDYIEEHYPVIKVVDMSKEQYYITDERYEYGVYPWYLNTMINEKVAECVSSIINEK